MKGKYCYRYGSEEYSGAFDSIEALKAELGAEFDDVQIGQFKSRVEWLIDGADILEFISDQTAENSGCPMEEGTLSYVAGEQRIAKELEIAIENILRKYKIDYWVVEEVPRSEIETKTDGEK